MGFDLPSTDSDASHDMNAASPHTPHAECDGATEEAKDRSRNREGEEVPETEGEAASASAPKKRKSTSGRCVRPSRKQKVGDRPEDLPEPDKSRLTMKPTLSPLLVPNDDLYDKTLSFDRIFASRCIDGVFYQVRVDAWNGEDACKDEDGLCHFLVEKIKLIF